MTYYCNLRVHPKYKKKLKVMAAERETSIIGLTKDLAEIEMPDMDILLSDKRRKRGSFKI